MRHGDKIKNLGRKKAHRDALLSNLSLPIDPAQENCNNSGKSKSFASIC